MYLKSIEEPLWVLRSTFKPYNSREYGRSVESRAADYFVKNSYKILYRNKKIWGVEHDFVLLNTKNEVLFVEVKSLRSIADLCWRVKPRQQQRLMRSAAAFVSQHRIVSRGVWVFALEESGRCHFLPLETGLVPTRP